MVSVVQWFYMWSTKIKCEPSIQCRIPIKIRTKPEWSAASATSMANYPRFLRRPHNFLGRLLRQGTKYPRSNRFLGRFTLHIPKREARFPRRESRFGAWLWGFHFGCWTDIWIPWCSSWICWYCCPFPFLLIAGMLPWIRYVSCLKEITVEARVVLKLVFCL